MTGEWLRIDSDRDRDQRTLAGWQAGGSTSSFS
jgi:hypothetical protein